VEPPGNVVGQAPGSGSGINQVLINNNPFAPETVRYSISSFSTDENCVFDPVIVEVTVRPRPEPVLLQVGGNCLGDCVQLEVAGELGQSSNFLWNTGESTSTGFLESCNIPSDNFYQVTVTNAFGCQGVADLFVSPVGSPIDVDAGPDVVLNCNEPSTILTGTSDDPIAFFEWTTPAGELLTSSSILATISGTYHLQVTDVFGCTATDMVNVSRNSILVGVDAGEDRYLLCEPQIQLQAGILSGGNLGYQWTTTDGNIVSGGDGPTPTVEAGTYLLTIFDTANQCIGSDEVVVFSSIAQIAVPTLDSTSCANPDTLFLDASGSLTGPGVGYQWSTMDGLIFGSSDALQLAIGQAGTYQLVVTDTSNNCSDTSALTIANFSFQAIADAGADQAINCINSSVELQANGGALDPNFAYEWSSNGILLSTDPNLTVNGNGVYQLVVTNVVSGCTASDEVVVEEDLIPPVAFITQKIYNITCFNCPTVTLDASGSSLGTEFFYQWIGPSNANIQNNNSPLPSVDAEGTYQLVLTNLDNGCVSTASTVVSDLHTIEVQTQTINCDFPLGSAEVITTNITDPQFAWNTGVFGPKITDVSAGSYQVSVTGANGVCEEVIEVEVEEDLSCQVIIGGTIFADIQNPNCQVDPSEDPIEGVNVRLLPIGLTTTTNALGYYEFRTNPGTYTVEVLPDAPYLLQCGNGMQTVSLPDTSDFVLDVDFYLQVLTNFDLIISAQSGEAVPGTMQKYTLSYCNYGIQPISGVLTFTHDPQLTWPNPAAAGVSSYDPVTRTATWDFGVLPFLGCGFVQFQIPVPGNIASGSTLISQAAVSPSIGDLQPSNNQRMWTVTVSGPNSIPSLGTIAPVKVTPKADELRLFPNAPNPFSDQTRIAVYLPQAEVVDLTIYDLNGRLLLRKQEHLPQGKNEIVVKAEQLQGAGILLYRVQVGDQILVGKMFKQ
ncbi:MAG: SdrD B-like domain-containing protein, partial [Bacteroidota bacterium]